MAEQLTLNQWVLGSSPRGRTSKKIPLILRNRRDFCVPRIMRVCSARCIYPLCSCRGPVLAELGHPDVAAEDICTSACIGILGTLRSRRGCGRCAVVQYVRPVPSELVRGRLSRFGLLLGGWVFCVWGGEGCRGLVCYLAAERLGWCAVFSGSALRVSHGRSPQRSKEGRSVRVTGAPA